MPKISEEQRAAARQRLIDATVAVAERDGVDGLTTRAIVAEAGVSAGMFYGHFDSKEALLAAVVDHKTDELTTLVHAELELGTPMEGVVRSLVDQLVRVLDLKVLASFRTGSGTEDALHAQRRINRRIVDAFVPLLEESVDAGVVRPDIDPEAVVEFIDLVIDGLNRRRALDGFVSSDDRLTAVIIAAFERYLLVPQEDPR
ncbi:TetR/AcrR family transcriptional regulator [Acidimicrobiia bacterium EGI L10123]|uniref:TetR/AcrR family transcriptional regulator n=1 Tax=Salinilacustrithrix flava TaxID=2957203 RepID=UPI003D7C25AD|nr:TetR/AcrR family transcriptional regulator [Acidimicrobiia bacterium EGI L10123]